MKKFDYEKAKAGAPVCTRDGRPARIVCWDVKYVSYSILALIKDESGYESVMLYTNKGKVFVPELNVGSHNSDLMMAPVKHDGWVHVNDEMGIPFIMHGKIYKTKEQANAAPKAERFITVAKIEWEEQP